MSQIAVAGTMTIPGTARGAVRGVVSTGARDRGPLDDPEAFNRLVLEHQDLAYAVAYRFLGTREAAEDATQEAFLRAYQARDRFQGGSFRAWLLKIVSNAALDELRRRKRRPQRSLSTDEDAGERMQRAYEPADPSPGPEAAALHGVLRRQLEAALQTLPRDMRLAVVLRDVQGLSYEEVAEATGVPVGTVRSRLSRARGRLRETLLAARVAELLS